MSDLNRILRIYTLLVSVPVFPFYLLSFVYQHGRGINMESHLELSIHQALSPRTDYCPMQKELIG